MGVVWCGGWVGSGRVQVQMVMALWIVLEV